MQGKNHLAIALAGALTVANPGNDVTSWVAFGLGSLAPDIDGHGYISHPGEFMPRMVPHFIRDLADAIGHLISDVVEGIFGHRGAFHYPVWYALMIVAGQRLGLAWLSWLGAGCLVHLAGDIITKSGIPVFGPIWRRDIALPPYIKTGTWSEAVVSLLLWFFITWRLYVLLETVPEARHVVAQIFHYWR
jgi:membrane-bound metal-dependent hydrolase YbcI (DUF457 family)